MTLARLTMTVLMLNAALSCCAAPGSEAPQAPPDSAPPPSPPPPKVEAPSPEAPDPAAADLLDRLERAAADLHDFQAQITYWKLDAALEREEIRQGQVIYQVQPDGTRRFAILLDLLIANGRQRERHKHYIFDGGWLIEIDREDKLCIKRQVVAPGKHFDPLKLGEGPFPMPIGQPRKEVQARFVVSARAHPEDATLAKALGETPVEGLLLVPRPGTTEAKDIANVEIFYDPTLLLPVGICLTETSGDRKTVVLRNLKRNQGVDEKLLAFDEPDPKDWRVIVEPWKE